jgi:hypothetical protein
LIEEETEEEMFMVRQSIKSWSLVLALVLAPLSSWGSEVAVDFHSSEIPHIVRPGEISSLSGYAPQSTKCDSAQLAVKSDIEFEKPSRRVARSEAGSAR